MLKVCNEMRTVLLLFIFLSCTILSVQAGGYEEYKIEEIMKAANNENNITIGVYNIFGEKIDYRDDIEKAYNMCRYKEQCETAAGMLKSTISDAKEYRLNLITSNSLFINRIIMRGDASEDVKKHYSDALGAKSDIEKATHLKSAMDDTGSWSIWLRVVIAIIIIAGIISLWMATRLKLTFVFCWNNIPGKDDEKLKRFLGENYDNWAMSADKVVKKSDNIIRVYKARDITHMRDRNFLLELNNGNTKANIATDTAVQDEFVKQGELIVKTESGKLNVYSK
jgi:hypothetical protein